MGSLPSPLLRLDNCLQTHLKGHFPLLFQVCLVADQHHHDLSRVELLLQVLQPLLNFAKGILKKENGPSGRLGVLPQPSQKRQGRCRWPPHVKYGPTDSPKES